MDAEAMVGSMGLTFFCNRCVVAFNEYRKQRTGASDNLKKVCHTAINAFNSLRQPFENPEGTQTEKVALFDTNQEVNTFERVLLTNGSGSEEEQLNKLISDLKAIIDDKTPFEEKSEIAERMQKFFDTLGDYSFYATRECIEKTD